MRLAAVAPRDAQVDAWQRIAQEMVAFGTVGVLARRPAAASFRAAGGSYGPWRGIQHGRRRCATKQQLLQAIEQRKARLADLQEQLAMKRAGAVLGGSPDIDAEDLAAEIYKAMAVKAPK